MATIQLSDGERVVLFDEHVIGRSSRCDTKLEDSGTSSRHALFYWDGADWRVRDLGSTNGTAVDGKTLAPGATAPLSQGCELRLGERETVSVVDVSAPRPTALSLDSSLVCTGTESLILVPDDKTPTASFVLEAGSQWWFDAGDEPIAVDDGDVVEHLGQRLRFFASRGTGPTRAETLELRLAELHFHFRVSLDEEHVRLTVRHPGGEFDLGSRSHHYTTLNLARLRQADAERSQDEPESSHGWVDGRDLMRQLGSNDTKLSVEICRIRGQLAKLGVADAADVIERRRGTGQLRLGTSRFEITRE